MYLLSEFIYIMLKVKVRVHSVIINMTKTFVLHYLNVELSYYLFRWE